MVFTIAIPTYNNDYVLRAAVESCINQDFGLDYEVLVVNNHCTDNTQALLDEYKGKIRVVVNPKTVTPAENHNICIQEATGDYIVFCHSDDTLLSDALSKFHGILEKRGFPKKYVLWGRSMYRDYYQNWKKTGLQLDQICSGFDCFKAFFAGGLAPTGTCYSRESLRDAGGFITVEHRLAPIDMIVLWRLVLRHFEFEMCGHIFFVREFASTVVELATKSWMDSAVESVGRFLDIITPHEREMFIHYIRTARTNNFDTYLAFRKKGLVSRKYLLKNLTIQLTKNPLHLFSSRYWKILRRIIAW
ncbi:MAG: glycosyltransferase family 2 protein [Prolixibacteraceae bacterium]